MGEKPLPPGMHVILGDSAAGTFDEVFNPRDSLLIDRDVLSCGPTSPCDVVDAWKSMRHQYWSELAPMAASEPSTDRALLDEFGRLLNADRVTIWASTSVSEQLFIAHVLYRAAHAGLDASKIQLVSFEKFPHREARVLGMGELEAGQLRDYPEPRPLSGEELRDYRDAWAALVSSDPTLLGEFAKSHPDAIPWLSGAMQMMLRRFPDRQSGLPHWDRELLEGVKRHAPNAARAIGYTMTRQWADADLTGDWYLFGRLLRMGRAPTPLVEVSGDIGNMRATEVKLTPFGLDVLEGRASNYPANPIDDWAAGVRLSSRDGNLWFNDNGKLVRHS